jgi:hypothetical protein
MAVACASASPPPGGPEDHAPPLLVRVTPDTNAVHVTDKVVSFYFDETINDRGSGAQEVSNYFLVSPSDGNAHVSWHRSRIDVRPRFGFRPNTAYTVTLLPGLSDLRNNVMKTGGMVVFSTGATIPTLHITGTVFDWVAGRPAMRALLQAVTPDSSIYLAQSDTVGHFSLGPLPEGTYLVRAVMDANGNRALDRNEAYDSVRVVTPHPAPLELLAIIRDTLPPRLLTVTVVDSTGLRVTFDRPLDETAIPVGGAFRLAGPDSVPIAVTSVLTPTQETDAAKVIADARADSLRRVDSLARRAAVPTSPAARPTLPARVTATAPTGPKPSRPAPPTSLLLRIAHPLAPGTIYRIVVTEARALSGRVAASERSFTTPKPPPPAAPADSSHKPAASTVRTTPVTARPVPALPTRVPPRSR